MVPQTAGLRSSASASRANSAASPASPRRQWRKNGLTSGNQGTTCRMMICDRSRSNCGWMDETPQHATFVAPARMARKIQKAMGMRFKKKRGSLEGLRRARNGTTHEPVPHECTSCTGGAGACTSRVPISIPFTPTPIQPSASVGFVRNEMPLSHIQSWRIAGKKAAQTRGHGG